MAKFLLTAQNIDIYDGDGLDAFARTGATSGEEIARAGAAGLILGHSEVGDSVDATRKKLLTVVEKTENNSGFLPYITLLVGETWDEFEGQSPEAVAKLVTEHLMFITEGLPESFIKHLVVGYEPKWGSRGSGRDDMPPPSVEFISLVTKSLREALDGIFGEAGRGVPVIYGGRSTPERTLKILSGDVVEGLILGSACNTTEKTMAIAKSMEEARPGKRKILHANFKAYNLSDSYEEYVRQLKTLDDTFIIYLSPAHTDIREVKEALQS